MAHGGGLYLQNMICDSKLFGANYILNCENIPQTLWLQQFYEYDPVMLF